MNTESKTPRTDALNIKWKAYTDLAINNKPVTFEDFARTLELELADYKAAESIRSKELTEANRKLEEANRKLEECSLCHMDKGDVQGLIADKDRKLEDEKEGKKVALHHYDQLFNEKESLNHKLEVAKEALRLIQLNGDCYYCISLAQQALATISKDSK